MAPLVAAEPAAITQVNSAIMLEAIDRLMQPFVIIFRQPTDRPLSADELKARADATRPWAQGWNAAGHHLTPHILTPASHWYSGDGRSGAAPTTAAGPITALLFLEAEDVDQAVAIARAHPALHYGASVEVRAWAPATAPR